MENRAVSLAGAVSIIYTISSEASKEILNIIQSDFYVSSANYLSLPSLPSN